AGLCADTAGMTSKGSIARSPACNLLTELLMPVLVAMFCTSWSFNGAEAQEQPELFPGRAIAPCESKERPATGNDVPLTTRIPVLAEPKDWLDVPGPRGERAEGWQGRRPGFRVFDHRGRLLHVLPDVSLPRWSPDGRWLAVNRWSRELPYQLALVEVGTGR